MLQARLDWWLPGWHQVMDNCLVAFVSRLNSCFRIAFVSCANAMCSYMLMDLRILAPTTYIFFASAIPVISFGEQLERNTGIFLLSICLSRLCLHLKIPSIIGIINMTKCMFEHDI